MVVHRGNQETTGSPGAGRSRRTVATLAVAGLALVGWPSAAAAGTGTGTSTSTSGTTAGVASTAGASPSARSVTLVTGDRVTIDDIGGHTSYAVAGKSGGSGQFDSYQTPAGDHYLIPAEAVPYLGRQLDAGLFDVTALLRSGLTSGARIPVSLSFTAGATPAAPPGVTLTSVGFSTATGYLTAASGAAFAAGLRAAIGADVRAGRQPGTGPLFGGLASIGLATAGVTGPTAQPRYPLHILQINADDLTGAPASDAFAILLNTDSISRQNAFTLIAGGIARIAVPAGNYSTVVSFIDFDAQGNVTAQRMVSIIDFAVSADAPTTTVTVDERTATVPITVTTPRPAVQDAMDFGWWRKDAAGVASGVDFIDFGSGPANYTNTQPAATIGSFRYHLQWGGAGPATGQPYRYDLAFGSDVLPANQSHTVRPGQVATLHQAFYADPASNTGGSLLNGQDDGFLPYYSLMGGGESYSGPVTQYLASDDGDQWWQDYFAPTGVQFSADLQPFRAGRDYRLDWAHGPLAPNVGAHSGTASWACFACASGNALSLGFTMAGDSDPGHTALSFFGGTTKYTLYQNGAVVFDQADSLGTELKGIPSTQSTYREVFDADLTGVAGMSQSTSTHTDVTFKYQPGAPGDTLPSSDACDYELLVTAPCQILPVLSLGYHLTTDHTNTSDSSLQSMALDVSHLSYDGRGSHARITSATVSVSFDGGATWQPAAVFGAQGHYWALWHNPRSAAGTSPALKVTATDTIGGSITQTVANAYTIATSVH